MKIDPFERIPFLRDTDAGAAIQRSIEEMVGWIQDHGAAQSFHTRLLACRGLGHQFVDEAVERLASEGYEKEDLALVDTELRVVVDKVIFKALGMEGGVVAENQS